MFVDPLTLENHLDQLKPVEQVLAADLKTMRYSTVGLSLIAFGEYVAIITSEFSLSINFGKS